VFSIRSWKDFSPAEDRKIRVSVLSDRYLEVAEVIPSEFIPGGTTVNSHCYLGVMERLYARIGRIGNQQFRNKSWLLLHINAPAHCAMNVK